MFPGRAPSFHNAACSPFVVFLLPRGVIYEIAFAMSAEITLIGQDGGTERSLYVPRLPLFLRQLSAMGIILLKPILFPCPLSVLYH